MCFEMCQSHQQVGQRISLVPAASPGLDWLRLGCDVYCTLITLPGEDFTKMLFLFSSPVPLHRNVITAGHYGRLADFFVHEPLPGLMYVSVAWRVNLSERESERETSEGVRDLKVLIQQKKRQPYAA